MSWLNTSSFTSLAKSALREAQKTIDKALDIKEEITSIANPVSNDALIGNEIDKFFEAFGLSGKNDSPSTDQTTEESSPHTSESVVTTEPAVSSVSQGKQKIAVSLWGSFSGSFFEPGTSTPENTNSQWTSQTLEAGHSEQKDERDSVDSLEIVSSPEKSSPESIVVLSSSDSVLSSSSVEVLQSPDTNLKPIVVNEEEGSTNESFHSSASASSSLTVISPQEPEAKSEIPTLLAEAISDGSSRVEVSCTSGQTSGDEVDTTTSSDIEIVASPQMLAGNKTHHREPSEASSDEGAHELEKLSIKNLELCQILEVRESKVLELSRANAILVDENSKLQKKIDEFEKERTTQSDSIRKMTEDFAQRISGLEKRYQQLLSEKETLEKQQANTKLSQELQEQLIEKDQTIEELRQEGEKLSKQQLQLSNALKKLRTKEKETETLVNQLKSKNEELSRDIERLKKSLAAKEELERNQIDAVRQLTSENSAYEKEIAASKVVVREATQERDTLKTALENTKKELSDLKVELAALGSAEAERTLSAEVALRQQLRSDFEAETSKFNEEKVTLSLRIEELESTLSKADAEHHREVEQLKNELKRAMQRLHQAEIRGDELSQAVTIATRPLLRQIESLQSSLSAQRLAEEKTEKVLNERLGEALVQCAAAEEKERSASEKLQKTQQRAASLESQVSTLTQEKNQLTTQLQMLQMKLQTADENRNKEVCALEKTKETLLEEVAQMKRQLESLEHRLALEISALEAERRRNNILEEQLREKDQSLRSYSLRSEVLPSTETMQPVTPRTESPTPSLERVSTSGSLTESFSSNPWAISDDVFVANSSTPVAKSTLYDSLRSGPNASVFENLQAQLKVREGEVQQLQHELHNLQKTREALTEELTRAVARNEEISQRLEAMEKLKEEFDDLHKKYNALLQMYGEKVEENEELKLDLLDVKEMYKAQINQLLHS